MIDVSFVKLTINGLNICQRISYKRSLEVRNKRNVRHLCKVNFAGLQVKLAKRYLEQTDTTIAFTHHKNMLENMQLPKIHTTNSWKSSALPQKTTSTNRVSNTSDSEPLNSTEISSCAIPGIVSAFRPQIRIGPGH